MGAFKSRREQAEIALCISLLLVVSFGVGGNGMANGWIHFPDSSYMGLLASNNESFFLMNCVYFSFFHFSLFSAPLLHDALFARTENLYLLIERSYKTVCSSASAFLYKYRVFCGYLEFWLEMTPWKSQTALLHDRPEMGCRRVLKQV